MPRRGTQSPAPQATPAETKKPATSSKWADLGIRFISAVILGFSQIGIMLGGYKCLAVEFLLVQYVAFYEFIRLAGSVKNLRAFCKFMPYLLATLVSFYIAGPLFVGDCKVFKQYSSYLSLATYIIGSILIMLYVMCLRYDDIHSALSYLGYSIIGIVIIIIPINYFIHVAERSLFWFCASASIVVFNDTMAYFFGRIFGKHSLIALSPKKTWEGFIGAAISTIIFSFYLPIIIDFPIFYCHHVSPFDFDVKCKVPESFVKTNYTFYGHTFNIYPAQIYGLIVGVFASFVAPFGGFLASALKRAKGIKDFGNCIPGHGGILDRIDCQLAMGSMVEVLLFTVIFK